MKRVYWLAIFTLFVYGLAQAQSGVAVFLRPEFFLRKHLINYEPPHYPDAARDTKVQGTVHLFVAFDTLGGLAEAKVLASPDESLSKAVLAASKGWRLKAYSQGPEAFYLGELRIVFTLEDGSARVTEASEADQRKVSDRFTKEKTHWIKRHKGQG